MEKNLPVQKSWKRNKAGLCREVLKELDSYLVEADDVLDELYAGLLGLKDLLSKSVPKEKDIALLPSSLQPNFKSFRLPMRKRKVDNVKRFRKVEVTDDSMNSQNLVSEIVIEKQPLNISFSYYVLS